MTMGALDFLGNRFWEADVLSEYLSIRKNLRAGPVLQDRRLQVVVTHAYNTVPYYRKLLDSKGIRPGHITGIRKLGLLPLTSKQHYRELDMQERISSSFRLQDLLEFRTGGTTGTPLKVYLSKKEADRRIAEAYRIYAVHGYSIFDSIAQLMYYPSDREWYNRLGIAKRIDIPWNIGAGLQADLIRKERPRYLEGYPSRLSQVARYVLERGMKFRGIKGIFSNSETLLPGARKAIESAFGAKATNVYESWEFGRIAWECPEHRGLHINADSLIVEVLSGGRPAEKGEIVITSLNGFAMPLIRYRTGDIGEISHERCRCGIVFPMLREVFGRANDKILLSSGREISSTVLDCCVLDIHEIKEYQVVQDRMDEIKIRIVPARGYTSEKDKVLIKRFREACGKISVKVIRVDSIQRTHDLKLRTVVCNIR